MINFIGYLGEIMKNIAVIFAGGVGKRMNNNALPKQFLTLHGKEIIIHTIEKFEKNKNIDAIIVVCVEGWIDFLQKLLEKYSIKKVISIVKNGNTGQESIFNGLCKAKELFGENNIVLIHDGVRPIIDNELIDKNIESVKKYGTAVSCSKVTETVILRENDLVNEVVDRQKSWLAKAPQSFVLKNILECHIDAVNKGLNDYIDSATIMRAYGFDLNIVECSNENIKITTPTDYYIFRAIFEKKENEQLL